MSYIINIYQKDTRTRSGKRLCGSYEYELEEKEDMERKVRELHALYKACMDTSSKLSVLNNFY